jgi:outer membrane lipopolysaccharide assembly protein LptE/RlpB
MLRTEKMNTEVRIQNIGLKSLPVNSSAEKCRNPSCLVRTIRNYRWLSMVCLVLLVACGYQMVGKETHVPSGLNSVAIPTFKNRTYEPGIEIPFTQAFLREFILDRRVNVVDRMQADSLLEGVITDFRMVSVSYDQSGLVLEYQTFVTLDLTLKDRTEKVLWQQKNFSETQWFRASSNVLTSEANKAAAIQQIGKLVAERLRNRFFYNF